MIIEQRTAETTRDRILEAAHLEIYTHGYQGMRIESILQKTNLAKGALYHHFPNKLALGYAVVEEILLEHFQCVWNSFLAENADPLTAMQKLFAWKVEHMQTECCFNGCPLNNLSQEMSALDEGFHQRLRFVMDTILNAIGTALAKGQEDGFVRKELDAKKTALFLHCCYQGIMGTAKCMQAPELLSDMFGSLVEYIDTLRARDC